MYFLSLALVNIVLIKCCYDGDTCNTYKGERIRLACIDAPELKGSKANKDAAIASRDHLRSLVEGQKVNIRRITVDRYGRTVAELYRNGLNVQKELVERGYAKVYQRYAYQCPWAANR